MTLDEVDATTVKRKTLGLSISSGAFMVAIGAAILAVTAFFVYQIAWHSPSAYQSYESGQICTVLKEHVCSEIGMAKFALGYPCGNRDARWSASNESTGIEVYGITTRDAKDRFIALASVELEKLREVKALSIQFYDKTNNGTLIEARIIRRRKP